jgi:hypothetical protein
MNLKKLGIVTSIMIFLFISVWIALVYLEFEYAYMPQKNQVESKENRKDKGAYDVWGKLIPKEEAEKMLKSKGHVSEILSLKNGAVKIDDQLLDLGRETFYKETFGNEVFLTDIMGVTNGPLTIQKIMKAIMELKGEGTTNLQVELAKSATIGGQSFKKGEKIDTGIDVPKGSYAPLGMPVTYSERKVRVGISCAACHATVDRETKKVIEGVTNPDLNTGLIMALASNSAAYFTHTEISSIKNYIRDMNRLVTTVDGKKEPLPDPLILETEVDKLLLKWPRGNFDSSIDLKSNPTQVPDSFTLGDHPYGWSGFAQAGPFRGLSVFSNNVHAQNADTLSQSEISKALFGIDKEVYLGTILQNAADPAYRFNPEKNEKPSEFFKKVDPTPHAPGVNEMIKPPTFPNISLVAPDGLIVSSPGFKVNEQNNAVAGWQNTLEPPKPKMKRNQALAREGERVFNKAGCISCHAGNTLTNNKVISSDKIGTEPSRGQALKKTEKIFDESKMYAPSTKVPIKENARVLDVPVKHLDQKQVELAFAKANSSGGYKVPSLIGLYWSAPYLHDGGVAVGPDIQKQLGMTGTLMKGIIPDPSNSLRALVDRRLREKVVTANCSSNDLKEVRVKGIGHEFWVDDSSGFTKKEQDALIHYLLTFSP